MEESVKGHHIAMFTILSPGHVFPMLGLSSELVRRGNRITYPVMDAFAEKIRQTGGEPVVFKVPEFAEKVPRQLRPSDPRYWPLYASISCPQLLVIAAATVAELEDFYQVNRPDLIVYDRFSFAGRILAKRLKCPAVQVWTHFAQQDFVIREEGIYRNPEPIRGFVHILNSFMSAYGIEDHSNFWFTENLNIYFVPPEFQFDTHLFDSRSHFVGPCLNRPPQSAWIDKSNGKPILLISESSLMRDSTFFNICTEAFAESDYHVVFSIGASTPPIQSHSVPANFQINRDAYNIEVLPHAAAFVCQSGMGVALESLYFGVPLVTTPNHSFNAEVAYRIEELGLGVYLRDSKLSPRPLRASVDTVVADATVRERLKAMQKAVHSSGGAKLAADLIESAING
jgi:MGT family glycosyltransferase